MRLVSTAICAVGLIARQAAASSVLKGKVGNANRQEPFRGRVSRRAADTVFSNTPCLLGGLSAKL
jgi:hypothetical protein